MISGHIHSLNNSNLLVLAIHSLISFLPVPSSHLLSSILAPVIYSIFCLLSICLKWLLFDTSGKAYLIVVCDTVDLEDSLD